MSDDVKVAASPHQVPPPSPSVVMERAVVLNRPNAREVGTVFVDDVDAISTVLVNTVSKKTFSLKRSFRLTGVVGLTTTRARLQGQVGLIRVEELESSPDPKRPRTAGSSLAGATPYKRFIVQPVTARHNVQNQLIKVDNVLRQGLYDFSEMGTFGVEGTTDVMFPDGGEAPEARIEVRKQQVVNNETLGPITWDLFDITKGMTLGSSDNRIELTKSIYSFAKAPEGYKPAAGHKIGIVVSRFWDIDRANALYEGTETEWNAKRGELFGPLNKRCVYTGEILRVSDDGQTFEHNINSFKGCSGAIIFLLDIDQVDEVSDMAGTAIGVHVGCPPNDIEGSNVNIAFTLT